MPAAAQRCQCCMAVRLPGVGFGLLAVSVPGAAHLAVGLVHLPAADGRVVADLLAVHLGAVGVGGLVRLPQNGVEGLVERDLPAQARNRERHDIAHAVGRVRAGRGRHQQVLVLPVGGQALQEAARLKEADRQRDLCEVDALLEHVAADLRVRRGGCGGRGGEGKGVRCVPARVLVAGCSQATALLGGAEARASGQGRKGRSCVCGGGAGGGGRGWGAGGCRRVTPRILPVPRAASTVSST